MRLAQLAECAWSAGVPSGVASIAAYASLYGIVLIFSKPLVTAAQSKPSASASVLPSASKPTRRQVGTTDAWQCKQAPGCGFSVMRFDCS
jgi:hypothetical protein